MSLKTYITERKQNATRTAVNGVEFLILDKGKFETADIKYLLNQIEEKTSPEASRHINQIKLGSFPKLEKENYKSYYKDGVMYLSNKENFVEEILMNFFHELAHSFEKPYFDQIYGDRFLEKEILNKRNQLKRTSQA